MEPTVAVTAVSAIVGAVALLGIAIWFLRFGASSRQAEIALAEFQRDLARKRRDQAVAEGKRNLALASGGHLLFEEAQTRWADLEASAGDDDRMHDASMLRARARDAADAADAAARAAAPPGQSGGAADARGAGAALEDVEPGQV